MYLDATILSAPGCDFDIYLIYAHADLYGDCNNAQYTKRNDYNVTENDA